MATITTTPNDFWHDNWDLILAIGIVIVCAFITFA